MSTRKLKTSPLWALALVAALGMGLQACVHDGDADEEPVVEPPPQPQPTPVALPAEIPEGWEPLPGDYVIPAGAYGGSNGVWLACGDDGPDCVVTIHADGTATAAVGSGTVEAGLDPNAQAILDARDAAAAELERQKMALAAAAAALDISDLSTQEAVDAARMASEALRKALDEAVDVSPDDLAQYISMSNNAESALEMAQTAINEQIALKQRRDFQTVELELASSALDRALDALSGTPTQEQIDAAQDAVDALIAKIRAAANLTAEETSGYSTQVANAEGQVESATKTLMANNEAAEEEAEEEERKANEARAATAAKLYAGIHDLSADPVRTAAYGTGDNADDIAVTIGTEAVNLSEDEDADVADLHDWTGQMFTASPEGGGTYEARVYSNIGEPTEGAKFNSGDGTGDVGFNLDTDSTDTVTLTAALNVGSRIASERFTHTAGSHTFELPDPNPRTETTIPISGSYYGVAGTYTCTPTDTAACTVNKAAEGYVFASPDLWTFTATNPDARVTEMADTIYASYGWWLHTAANGDLTASAFISDHGTVPAAAGITALAGTAKYLGGAAGKYALSSSTGGTNDVGHFTADALLEADFNDDTIMGTIDNFIGGDGVSRNWSVALNVSTVSDAGAIAGDPDDDTDSDPQMTVWTIDGTAAAAAGQWSGNLKDTAVTEADDSGVPKVATGTFYSEYGTAGKMVGAFGANKE